MLDPNIPETGRQVDRSNSGPDSCCYRYCSASVFDGLCAVCDHEPPSTDVNLGYVSGDQEDFAKQCPSVELASAQSPSGCLTPFQAAAKSAAASAVWMPHRTATSRYIHFGRTLLADTLLAHGKPTAATQITWQTVVILAVGLVTLTLIDRYAVHCNAAVIAIFLISVNVSS